MPKARYSPVLALLLAACGDPGDADDTGTTPAATGATAATSTTDVATSKPGTSGELPTTTTAPTTGGSDTPAGLELMQRLAGLWTGPATMTPLGTFARMNMDLRAASAQVLFSRADLDEMNNLRFAFELEAPDGETTLVYRNGGYFLGLLRDSRTRLVEHTADSYRFCSTGAQVLIPLVAHLTPLERRGRVVGNVMAGLLTGIMLARPAALFLAASFGWRAVFWFSAVLMPSIVPPIICASTPSGFTTRPTSTAQTQRSMRYSPPFATDTSIACAA